MESKLNFIFKSTSIHGFKHMSFKEDTAVWKKTFSRIFWTTLIALAIFFILCVLKSSLGSLKSTSIRLDINYRDWRNAFPGISICLKKGQKTDMIKTYLKQVTNRNVSLKIVKAYENVIFINRNSPTESMSDEFKDFNETYSIDIKSLKNSFMPQSCRDFMSKVEFLRNEIDCEKIFVKRETEVGTCYIANELSSNFENYDDLPLTYENNKPVERSLIIDYKESLHWSYQFFYHAPEERPSERIEPILLRTAGTQLFVGLKTIEIHNDDEVKHKSIAARNCRFPFEKFEDFEMPYSLANCIYLKTIKLELDECGCTLPTGDLQMLRNKSMSLCRVEKFACVAQFAKKFKLNIKEYIGECLVPSCLSMDITKIAEFDGKKINGQGGVLKVEIMVMPTVRYIRSVVFTKLDMIVHVGGIIGLFIGASFISVIEIIFLLFDMRKIGKN